LLRGAQEPHRRAIASRVVLAIKPAFTWVTAPQVVHVSWVWVRLLILTSFAVFISPLLTWNTEVNTSGFHIKTSILTKLIEQLRIDIMPRGSLAVTLLVSWFLLVIETPASYTLDVIWLIATK
jgi:hypothetical protein